MPFRLVQNRQLSPSPLAPLFHEFVVEAEIEVGSSNCTDDRGGGRMFRTAGRRTQDVEDERKCHTRKVETTGLP